MKLLCITLMILFSGISFATEWEAETHRDMSTPEAKKYDVALAKFIVKNLNNVTPECYLFRNPPEFVFYVKILGDGTIAEKAYSDVSPEAICISKKYGDLKWPIPHFSPYYFQITMLRLVHPR